MFQCLLPRCVSSTVLLVTQTFRRALKDYVGSQSTCQYNVVVVVVFVCLFVCFFPLFLIPPPPPSFFFFFFWGGGGGFLFYFLNNTI